jgi:hypothetical protein
MAKITFETPCEIGDLYFYILTTYHYENGKRVNDYSIEPVRVDFFDYHYSNKETRLSITADYVNDNTRQCFKPNIRIGENAFKEFEKAEEKLIELRKENN